MQRVASLFFVIAVMSTWIGSSCLESTSVDAQESTAQAKKRIAFMAGRPSHGYASHEHYAGCALLARSLEEAMPHFETIVFQNGWPKEADAFKGIDVLVMYCDGGGGHPVNRHLDQVDELAKEGVGIICLHYGVEVPKGESGQKFLEWIGGYFETHWSVNPHWTADFTAMPDHPITRGVEPFAINDEWYYHMRFREAMEGVTPILTAIPPKETLSRPDGAHSGNPHVREKAGEPQHVAWAAERADGGRGFGFTGGHFHWNWGEPNFRRIVLNAIVWAAKEEIPAGGVDGEPVTLVDLEENQDFDQPASFDREEIRTRFNLPKDQKDETSSKAPAPKPLYSSPVITSNTKGHAVQIDIPIEGKRNLYLVVGDAGDGFSCDWANWCDARLIGPTAELSLTEMNWRRATSGWGQVQKNKNANGGPLRMAGKTFENGLGTHANSMIHFEIPAGYERFVATAGLDNGGTDQGACGTNASVQFFVYDQKPTTPVDLLRAPENALAGLDVADGLVAQLAASEPDLLSLTNLDIDHRGRIWVCEVVNYRGHNGKRPEGDRILILEDTNEDGVADEFKVFYQGRDVDSAMGICVLGNRVIVSCSPNVIVFTDEDGDDRPDKKEMLFTKTGQPQHDHSAHSFLFGPDGKLYWNFGNTGKSVHDRDGKVIVDMAGNQVVDNGKPYWGGMPFRCNLDSSEFEVLGHNFRNNYEVTVDSFGTLWQSDNDDDGNRGVRINYVMEFGNFGYRDQVTGAGWQQKRTGMSDEVPLRHWHLNDPGVVPNLLQTGAGSPTGITVYEGRLLPEVFWDQVIHCDAGPNIVRAYPVKPNGAGYAAESVDILHGNKDKWFRPADVCVAPDGSLFVTDWYDPGVGGHGMGDLERGRLFRIAPPNTPYKVSQFDFSTAEGAVEALQNPCMSVRYMAWRALHDMGSKAEAALLALWNSQNPRHRARALWLLGKIEGKGEQYVSAAIQDSNPDLRITGLRLARQLEGDVMATCAALVNDRAPQVRREVAIALRHSKSEEMPELWAELALQHDGEDRWYLEALGIGSDLRANECFQAWLERVGDDWNSASGREIVWRSRSKMAPKYLAQILSDPKLPEEQQPRFFRAFDFHQGPEKDKALESLLGL